MDRVLEKVCVHTFLTPGFMGWGELFLKGLRQVHGESIHVRIDSRDLSEGDIAFLHDVYGNVEVHNQSLDWARLAQSAGVSLETFHRWRVEVERGISTDRNHLFRIAISVNERYCSLPQVAMELREQGYDLMLHSDADIYIRRPLDDLVGIMSQNDLSLYIRPNHPHRLAVVGGFLGFRLNDNTQAFLERWMDHIAAVPFSERWKGFGQSTLWQTVRESHDTSIADLMHEPGAPRISKLFEREKELWLGNAKVKGPVKVVAIQRCWEDLQSKNPDLFPQIPLPEQTISERAHTEFRVIWLMIKGQIKKILRPEG